LVLLVAPQAVQQILTMAAAVAVQVPQAHRVLAAQVQPIPLQEHLLHTLVVAVVEHKSVPKQVALAVAALAEEVVQEALLEQQILAVAAVAQEPLRNQAALVVQGM
jgi:hypothetical protein